MGDRPGRDLDAAVEFQLRPDIGDMCIDGPLADDQLLGDLTVGKPPSHEQDRLLFTGREGDGETLPCIRMHYSVTVPSVARLNFAQ